jgi:predicted nucleic acid-binding protein
MEMVKTRLYLDTTVPSAYCDERAPDRQRLTQLFWASRLPDFDGMISSIVLREVQETPSAKRREKLQRLIRGFTLLPFDEQADQLAREYVERGIFPEKYSSDANHVAIAVVNGIAYFTSWNFRHLVKVATRREVNLVNALKGYGPIEIVAPPEL